ncbi:MAG: delta-aminolevulinic acid dehydratase [Clostridia bacterium]|nr:delta-aminolevulinic acid dehydratase [Clostridia bacterium]MBQ3957002.1 delta-aminolevulinic acid dehydratase [Clostridia bacterium]MBQ4350109.1 delta-aminolevulinic acid dehydratase [Clostridia bacterium]
MDILIVMTGVDFEAFGLRTSLELFGARVYLLPVGRPKHFLDALAGRSGFPEPDAVILCGHGDRGAFLMPDLAESIYLPDEPRGPLGPDELRGRIALRDKIIVSTGCDTGYPETLAVFAESGNFYAAPSDSPEGGAAYFWTVRFFYGLLCMGLGAADAAREASSTDAECGMFVFRDGRSVKK